MATVIYRFDVANMMVLIIPMKVIILPKREKRPKSTTPNAFKANRVVNNEQSVTNISLTYRMIELMNIVLLEFSCILLNREKQV